AVDACVAAAFVSWVTESPLTGPGGGGFMLVHGRDGRSRVYDFFVAVPSGAPRPMDEVDVVFEGGDSSQIFRIGHASCAVPGNVLGLETAHRAHGSMPWAELFAPAIEHARAGIELASMQAYLHAILDSILRHTPEGREVYGRDARIELGGQFVQPDLAATLERIAQHGSRELYGGEIGRALVAHLREHGGRIEQRDLEEYRVIRRRPVVALFREYEFRSNPPPSSGGVLVGLGLQELESRDGRVGSAEAMAAIADAMRAQTAARGGAFVSELYRGGLAKRLLSGTTHISVLDARGEAASLSSSLGSGSGVVVPGTGVHLNNMLGETDLLGGARPGARLTSMMAPSVVLRDERPRLVVGSAGSARLRGAIMQAVVNVVGHGLDVARAIDAPRVHLEEELLHCEGGADPAE